ncbi:MAG: helix-turn-helix domain-containing protein [Bacteroidota bacterium]
MNPVLMMTEVSFSVLAAGTWLGVWLAATLGVAVTRLMGLPGRPLGVALMALAYVQVALLAHVTGHAERLPVEVALTAAAVGMMIAPLVYLAVREWLDPQHGWRAVDAFHFIPALVQFSVQLPVLVAGSSRAVLLDEYIGLGLIRSFLPGIEVARLMGVVYLGLMAWHLVQAARDPERRGAVPVGTVVAAGYGAIYLTTVFIFSADSYAWLRPVLVTAVLAALQVAILARLPALRPRLLLEERVAEAVVTSGDGHLAAPLPELASSLRVSPVAAVPSIEGTSKEPGNGKNKYERSRLSDRQKATLRRQLLALMDDEKAYLDSALTLEKAGERAGALPRHVSQVVNEMLGQSFTDFVNGYRVAAAQQLLRDASFGYLTVVAVGEEAGFASKSSFYEAFKRATGTTPASYRALASADTLEWVPAA